MASIKRNSPANKTSANSTADRALEILLAFNHENVTWSPTSLALHLDVPRSTIYRYINSLKQHGLIIEDGHGGYQLSSKIIELARVAKGTHMVLRIARPYLEELSEKFGEFTSLRERIGLELVPLDRIECRHLVSIPYMNNTTFPWPATAGAKVMLAFLPKAEADDLFKEFTPRAYTSNTITDRDLLEKEFKKIRKQGFAISNEERDEGLCGVAAPVLFENRLSYCVTLGGPAFRFKGTKLTDMADSVTRAAQAITKELSTFAY